MTINIPSHFGGLTSKITYNPKYRGRQRKKIIKICGTLLKIMLGEKPLQTQIYIYVYNNKGYFITSVASVPLVTQLSRMLFHKANTFYVSR